MRKSVQWKSVKHPSGRVSLDRTVGSFTASVIDAGHGNFVCNVKGPDFHKRFSARSVGGAKSAATRLLKRLSEGSL